MTTSLKTSRATTPTSENVLVPREKDFINAKGFLLQPSDKCNMSLYDFLVAVIHKLYDGRMEQRPILFEEACRQIKRDLYKHKEGTIRPVHQQTSEYHLTESQRRLFEIPENLSHIDEDIEEKPKIPNLLQTFFYFEQASIGLNREEIIRLWLSMKHLAEQQPIQDMRFWGKIFGTKRNYYVVEASLLEGKDNFMDELDLEKEKFNKVDEPQEKAQAETTEEEKEIVDEPPKPEWKPPVVVPYEENGIGVNKKIFFVCNVLGEEWIRLPKATPAQIAVSRQITKYLTGDLDTKIVSYPPFPGTEKNYLRAIISRITATTTISPLGFYTFDEEEEEAEEEEGATRSKFVEDPEWEPIPLRDLVDPGLTNWVHNAQYILPQGRTSWWNPTSKKNEEMEEEDEEEEKEEMDEAEPESGPPLLTPINEDTEVNGMPAWTPRISSSHVPQYSVAVLSSNLWPGAYSFATGKTFDNIYIGWGTKYSSPNTSPLPLAAVQVEFPSGPEITEIEDPTPDEEAAFRASQIQAAEAAEDAKEEEEEEEEEAEEEDD